MNWFTRELTEPVDIRAAAEDVEAWGFPRPLDPLEIEYGSWFRMGRTVLWWYEPPHPDATSAALVHLIVAPRVRSAWPVRRWLVAVEVIAELMGYDRLMFAPFSRGDRMADYAVRLGWVWDGPRLVRMLGGVDWARNSRKAASPALH